MSQADFGPEDIAHLSEFLYRHSGMMVSPEKTYMIRSRLDPVAQRFGLEGAAALIKRLRAHPERELVEAVVDAMTINETSFFRDRRPFDFLERTVLPDLVARRSSVRRLRLWSAAAATGQEAYSLAMCLYSMEEQLRGWRLEVLASDISHESLAKAKRGIYSKFEIQRGVPAQLLVRCFREHAEGWEIRPEIRKYVRFFHHNLLEPARQVGTVDVVFLRNVLIYMDEETRRRILRNIVAQLAPDGYLLVGGTESLAGLSDSLEPVRGFHAAYRPKSAASGIQPARAPGLAGKPSAKITSSTAASPRPARPSVARPSLAFPARSSS